MVDQLGFDQDQSRESIDLVRSEIENIAREQFENIEKEHHMGDFR